MTPIDQQPAPAAYPDVPSLGSACIWCKRFFGRRQLDGRRAKASTRECFIGWPVCEDCGLILRAIALVRGEGHAFGVDGIGYKCVAVEEEPTNED